MDKKSENKLRKKFEALFAKKYPDIPLVRHIDFPDEYEEMQAEVCWEGFLMMAESLSPIKFKKDTFGEPCEWGGSGVLVVTVDEVRRWANKNAPFVAEMLPT